MGQKIMTRKELFYVILSASIFMLVLLGAVFITGCSGSKKEKEKEYVPTISEVSAYGRKQDIKLGTVYLRPGAITVDVYIKDTRLDILTNIDILMEELDSTLCVALYGELKSIIAFPDVNGIERIIFYDWPDKLNVKLDYDGIMLDADIDIPYQNINTDILSAVRNNILDVTYEKVKPKVVE